MKINCLMFHIFAIPFKYQYYFFLIYDFVLFSFHAPRAFCKTCFVHGATDGLKICKLLYIKPFYTFVKQYTKNEEIIRLLKICYAVVVELIVK